jgi:cold-inducible RNA-binding protein
MSDDDAGNKAIAGLNGKELSGRQLNVNEAQPKGDSTSGGRGKRDFGGRGSSGGHDRW